MEPGFEASLRVVLGHEGVRFGVDGRPVSGGYTDDPDDSGGETRFGVTVAVARRAGYRGEMRKLPYEIACEVYRKKYWGKLHLDDVSDARVAHELFDTAVNCGPGAAGRFLQRTLNLFSVNGKRYRRVKVDGKVGPATIRTLRRALKVKAYYPAIIWKALNCLQGGKYESACIKDPRKAKYAPGWYRTRVGEPS